MGVFDYLRCRARLPGTPPAFVEPGHEFQTKSFEDPWLERYEITESGFLYGPEGQRIQYDGELKFHSTNIVGWRAGQHYTLAGEDAEWVEYAARFAAGRLQAIEEVERWCKPGRRSSELWTDRGEATREPGAG